MLGWRSRIPASASLWNRITASGIGTNRWRSTLIATGDARIVVLAAVNPGEGPLGQVEEGPKLPKKKLEGSPFLSRSSCQLVSQPLRIKTRIKASPEPSSASARASRYWSRDDQPDQRQLIDQRLDIDFRHGERILSREDRGATGPWRSPIPDATGSRSHGFIIILTDRGHRESHPPARISPGGHGESRPKK